MSTATTTAPRKEVKDEAAIATPALIIDLPAARRNIERMAAYTAKHNLALRPHSKTHKSLHMARLQMEAGSVGMTVAKVGEAQIMAEAADDLLIAYPALDPMRTGRIAELAGAHTVRVGVDSTRACDALAEAAKAAGTTIGILVDIDVGFHRTGVQSAKDALAVAQHVERTPSLRLDGIMCFPGHVIAASDKQNEELQKIDKLLRETIELWKKNGLEAKIVSGGSTPTAYQSHLVKSYTEIRPGTYVYYDWNCAVGGWTEQKCCAAQVVVTVVSDAVPGKVVLDAGSKTLTSDRNIRGAEEGFGHIIEYPQAKIVRLSEEHGEVDLSQCDRKPRLGDRLHVIPNHICPCVNLQDFYWLRQDDGRYTCERVDARGRLS